MTNTTPRIADRRSLLIGVCALWSVLLGAVAADALTLDLPTGARLTTQQTSVADSYAMPVAAWNGEVVPSRVIEGALSLQAWRIEGGALTTLQVLRPLRDQLKAQGYALAFECDDARCGGFDFRFGTRVLPAPEMLVDLGDYRFLSAVRDGDTHAVTLMISRTRGAVFVQVAQVAPEGIAAVTVTDAAPVPDSGPQGPMGETLEARGRVILSDLAFQTGSSTLGEGPYESLAALARYLDANPSRRVALVGHTDAVGTLEGNIGLSKRRAASVADRLVASHGVQRAQIDAEGMGYLAPVAPNLTDAGREENRRVEAVLISTE